MNAAKKIATALLLLTLAPVGGGGGARAAPSDCREQLKSLPYLTWKEVKEEDRLKKGVVAHDPERAWKGVNVFTSENWAGARLLNMEGKEIAALSDRREPGRRGPWKLVEPYPGGDFLVLDEPNALFRIGPDSRVRWEKRMAFHHDVAVAEDGDIYALANRKVRIPELCKDEPVYDNLVVVLSPQGKAKGEYSLARLIMADPKLRALASDQKRREYCYGKEAWDIFHTNTVEIVGSEEGRGTGSPLEKGGLLICIRHLDLVSLLDPEGKRVVWSWGAGRLDRPHQPTVLPNRNILIFDNGTFRKDSRIIELDPRTEEIVWEYPGAGREKFFSESRGFAQRLPNRNTLITDSCRGRVFEITAAGETVWEFFNPFLEKDEESGRLKRAVIYRMLRISAGDPKPEDRPR